MGWELPAFNVGVLAFFINAAQWRASHLRNAREDLQVDIRSGDGRKDLAPRYDGGRSERYFAFLDRFLTWSHRVYGPCWSRQTFFTCLLLAFLHPLLAALITWVTTEQPNEGAIPVFQDLDGWALRLAGAGFFLVSLEASALIFWAALRYAPDFGLKVGKSVETLTQRVGFLSKATR